MTYFNPNFGCFFLVILLFVITPTSSECEDFISAMNIMTVTSGDWYSGTDDLPNACVCFWSCEMQGDMNVCGEKCHCHPLPNDTNHGMEIYIIY